MAKKIQSPKFTNHEKAHARLVIDKIQSVLEDTLPHLYIYDPELPSTRAHDLGNCIFETLMASYAKERKNLEKFIRKERALKRSKPKYEKMYIASSTKSLH